MICFIKKKRSQNWRIIIAMIIYVLFTHKSLKLCIFVINFKHSGWRKKGQDFEFIAFWPEMCLHFVTDPSFLKEKRSSTRKDRKHLEIPEEIYHVAKEILIFCLVFKGCLRKRKQSWSLCEVRKWKITQIVQHDSM